MTVVVTPSSPTLEPGTVDVLPRALAVTPQGRIVLLDPNQFTVAVFDHDGNEVRKWGHRGQGPGEFSQPEAVAVDGRSNVYVLDRRAQVSVFDTLGNHLWSVATPITGSSIAVSPGGVELLSISV